MKEYKFIVKHELLEGFVREIVISSENDFTDFHNILKKSIKLEGNELASFYICDEDWCKKLEITLIDMYINKDQDDKSEEENEEEETNKVLIMYNTKIGDIITDISQKLIYEYDFLTPKVFAIEIASIKPVKNVIKYPKVVNSKGDFTLSLKNDIDEIFDFYDISDEDLDQFVNDNEFEYFDENDL